MHFVCAQRGGTTVYKRGPHVEGNQCGFFGLNPGLLRARGLFREDFAMALSGLKNELGVTGVSKGGGALVQRRMRPVVCSRVLWGLLFAAACTPTTESPGGSGGGSGGGESPPGAMGDGAAGGGFAGGYVGSVGGGVAAGGGAGTLDSGINPVDAGGTCALPRAQAPSQACCLEYGVDACGAGLFCGAFDGRTVPTCYVERSRADGASCTQDIQCVSNSCNLAKGGPLGRVYG